MRERERRGRLKRSREWCICEVLIVRFWNQFLTLFFTCEWCLWFHFVDFIKAFPKVQRTNSLRDMCPYTHSTSRVWFTRNSNTTLFHVFFSMEIKCLLKEINYWSINFILFYFIFVISFLFWCCWGHVKEKGPQIMEEGRVGGPIFLILFFHIIKNIYLSFSNVGALHPSCLFLPFWF